MSGTSGLVHLVDDDENFRGALARVLTAAGFEVRTFGSCGDYLLRRDNGDDVACLLLDLCLPGPSGLDLQQALVESGHKVPIVFLSGEGTISASVRAMKAGAVDFLTKPVDAAQLLAAVRAAAAARTRERAQRERAHAWQMRFSRLTQREHDVLRHVVTGRRNKQIAVALGVAERTVKAHRAHIMQKLQVATVAELVRVAERWYDWDEGRSDRLEQIAEP